MKPRLKVVRVVTASYVVPWHLANTLRRMPADFEVCVVGQGVSSCEGVYPNIKWVDINIDRKLSPVSDLLALFALCRFLRAYKPDIVHSIMPKSGLLTAIAGFVCRVPVRIHTFTGQVWATKTGLDWAVHYVADKFINALNTVCLTDSLSQSAFLHEHKISYKGQPLPVLLKGSLSGVDAARFNREILINQADQLRERLGLDESNFVFAFIARKSRDKGAIDILKAFAAIAEIHPNAKLLFVGPDESDGEINKLYKTAPAIFHNVLNIGRVDNHEAYLMIADILCLPSYREGFGTIVIDAAALGVATIGSNIPGLIDSIEDGKTGYLFPVGDVDALTIAMLDAIENPAKYKKMGISAKARVEDFFTADFLYDALKEFYFKRAGQHSG